MNKKKLAFFLFSVNYLCSWAQLYNNGGTIYMDATAIVTVQGDVSNVQSGNIQGGGDIYVSGNWLNSAAFTAGNSTVHLNGTAQSVTTGGGSFKNVEATVPAGVTTSSDKTLLDNATVTGTLTFNKARILTQTNVLTIPSGGNVIRTNTANNASEYVIGYLNKYFNSASNVNQTFEVGVQSGYSPINIAFASATTPGTFTVKAFDVAGSNLDITSSLIDVNNHSNMYWNVVNNGVVYSSSSVTVYHNGFIGGGNPVNYFVQQYAPFSWTSSPNPPVAPNTVSTNYSGTTFFGNLIAGETSIAPPPPCESCIPSFSPERGKKYVLSAWVKESVGDTMSTYLAPAIVLSFSGASTYTFVASGKIIDGWQRIEQAFTIPVAAGDIKIDLVNTSVTVPKDVFFDDIRIHPFDANMKSFVYDPVNLRLVAELDNNNYATFYEYDEEGALVRVKKETERGVMTIKENKNNSVKK